MLTQFPVPLSDSAPPSRPDDVQVGVPLLAGAAVHPVGDNVPVRALPEESAALVPAPSSSFQ